MNSQEKPCVPLNSTTICLIAMLGLASAGALGAVDEIVLSAAPRASVAESQEIYEPLARYLSQATGKKVVYRNPRNWLTYQMEMRDGTYDLVFDGPAFVGWRTENLGHVPIVKLPGKLEIAVFARADNGKVRTLKDLVGRTLCGFAPPNLATLVVQFEFDNPVRQPMLVEVKGFRTAYDRVVDGKCAGGILQTKLLDEFDRDAKLMKVLFRSKPMPNQGFSAGPRIDAATRERIAAALLSEEGKRATEPMRTGIKGKEFEPAKAEDYKGLGVILSTSWGFDSAPPKRR